MADSSEILLKDLQAYIQRAGEYFLTATETIRNEGVSNYPIIVAYKGEDSPEIGIPLTLAQAEWQYRATTLEELYTKNLVEEEKIDAFRALYNHKSGQLCVLLIDEFTGADFVFVPLV